MCEYCWLVNLCELCSKWGTSGFVPTTTNQAPICASACANEEYKAQLATF